MQDEENSMDDKRVQKLINEVFGTPDYSSDSQLKKLMNDTFKANADAFDRVKGFSASYGLKGPVAKKRKNAILANIDKARAEFKGLRLRSVEESFVEFEAISFETYKYLDAMCSLVAGAAIWILDQLRLNGNLYKAYDYMPSDNDEIYYADIPFGIFHPAYEFELILSIAHMIITRNGGRSLTDEGKRNEEFECLLSLIDHGKLDHACKVFEEKQWDIITRAMKLAAFFDEEEQQILRKLKNSFAPASVLMVREPGMSHEEAMDLADRGDDIRQKRRWIQHDLAEYLYMPRKEIIQFVGNRYGAEILQGFTVDDPYEMCMGLVLLLDSGSHAPWLMKSGTTLMQYTAKMLPWYPYYEDEDFEEDDEEGDSFFDKDHFNRNKWTEQPDEPEYLDAYHTRFGDRNLAQIVYSLSNGVLPFRMHPFTKERKEWIENGMEEAVADKIEGLSELFFFNDFQAGALNLRRKWIDELKSGEESSETEDADADAESGEASGPKIDTEAELEKARKEIKNLRKALSEVSHEANEERTKYEHELKSLRQEHRELADLREIVFNREQGEQDDKESKTIDFPYSLQKRTVIFGGHESFLKTLRQLIPDAKYIDVDNYSFSPDIVRNADVVWVQNNYISHSQYGKILNITRHYGIQLRYFTYASAEKSARQLAEEDQKY